MRWFKHMTASADDEKLSKLKDAFGLEGYGFWWSVVEIVAEKVGKNSETSAEFSPENSETSAEFSPKKWGNSLGISPKKFRILAEFCANLGLFSVKLSENYIRIDMPNILKFRDEYTDRKTKKSGECRDKLRPSRARSSDPDPDPDPDPEAEAEKSARARDKKYVPEKIRHGSNGNVLLTPKEHDALCRKFTPQLTAKAIAFLDLHIGAKGKDEYKSHNLAMQKWVFDAVKEREAKQARASPNGQHPPWVSPAQRRLEANQQAGREAKSLLFGGQNVTGGG